MTLFQRFHFSFKRRSDKSHPPPSLVAPHSSFLNATTEPDNAKPIVSPLSSIPDVDSMTDADKRSLGSAPSLIQRSRTASLLSSVSQGANLADLVDAMELGTNTNTMAGQAALLYPPVLCTSTAAAATTTTATPTTHSAEASEPAHSGLSPASNASEKLREAQRKPTRRLSDDVSALLRAVETGKVTLPKRIQLIVPQTAQPIGLRLCGISFQNETLEDMPLACVWKNKRDGMYIRYVTPGSPAESAGLRRGDRIANLCNGKTFGPLDGALIIQRIRVLSQFLAEKSDPRDRVISMSIIRRAPLQLELTLQADATGYVGVAFARLGKGFVVTRVDAGSPADRAGITLKMELVAVNDVPLTHTECTVFNEGDPAALMSLLSFGDPVLLHLLNPFLSSGFRPFPEAHQGP